MLKFTVIAAALATSVFIVVPASAADLSVSSPAVSIVRISVANKSVEQIRAEINVAATSVCTESRDLNDACVTDAIADANNQLNALNDAHRTSIFANIKISPEGPSSIRVSLKDKSPEQIQADIKDAAQAVCKVTIDFADCVDAAVSDAKFQLRSIAQLDAPHNALALN
jgi:hypothetical protein